MSENNFGFRLEQRAHVSIDELRDKFLKESIAPFPAQSLATTMKFCEALDE